MLTLPPFLREPADLYRSQRSQYLTSHQLIDFRKCPLYFRKKQSGLIPEVVSEHYLLGAATHCLTLEGRQEFERQYVVGGPINPKTERPYGRDTKAYAEWESQQGKPCLSDEQFALCCQLAAVVHGHSTAKSLIRTGVAEGVLRAAMFGVDCQIRCDWFSPEHGLVDLKTCNDLDQFEADAEEYYYVAQMAFYAGVIDAVMHYSQFVPVHLIAVEKREPFRVAVFSISEQDLFDEWHANKEAIERLSRYRAANHWPTGYEEPRTLTRKTA